MKKFFKFVLITLLIIVTIALLIMSFISLDTIKSEISEYIEKNYKVKLVFGKPIKHSLFSPGKIILNDLKIISNEKIIFNVDKISLNIDINEVFKDRITIKSIYINKAKLDINDADLKIINKNKKEKKESSKSKPPVLTIASLRITKSSFSYNDINLTKVNLNSSIASDKLSINELSLYLYGGSLKLKGHVNYGASPISIESKGTFNNVDLNSWNSLLVEHKISMKGLLNMVFDIKWKDDKPKAPNGNILVKSKDVILTGLNIDKLLKGFIDSREVGLLDVAGFVALGPIGALVTNSLEASKSIPGIGSGESIINHINLDVKLDSGLLKMTDTAFSSPKNRISFQGSLNLPWEKFENFNVHILNKKGCTRITQKIKGKFVEPDFSMTQTVLAGAISPATQLLKKTKNILGCKIVYKGVVKHP